MDATTRFRRSGRVRLVRVAERAETWTSDSGSPMSVEPGDMIVSSGNAPGASHPNPSPPPTRRSRGMCTNEPARYGRDAQNPGSGWRPRRARTSRGRASGGSPTMTATRGSSQRMSSRRTIARLNQLQEACASSPDRMRTSDPSGRVPTQAEVRASWSVARTL